MRVRWIDTSRGFAILLVVLYHSTQWAEASGHGSTIWSDINDALATIRLPLFFAISGVLAAAWMTRSWRALFASKIATLAWLYLLWQGITLLLYLTVPNVATPGKTNLREILTAIATPVRPQGALWFLWALALFFVAAKILQHLSRWLVLGVSAAVSTGVTADLVQLGNVGWDGAAANFVFFAAGVYFNQEIKTFGGSLKPQLALACVTAWAAFVILIPTQNVVGINLVSRTLGLAAGVSIGYALSGFAGLGWVGRHTLNYYLPHYPFLIALAYVASVVELPASSVVWLPATFFAITVTGCTVLYFVARRSAVGRSAFSLPNCAVGPLTRWESNHRS